MSKIDDEYLSKILANETKAGHPVDQPYYQPETGYYEGDHKAILAAMRTIHNIAINKALKCDDKSQIEKLRT